MLINTILSMIQFSLVVFGPILLPLFLKKWTWLMVAVGGYLLFGAWWLYLQFTADVQDYGTALGMFFVPYLICVTAVGAIVQKNKDKQKVSKVDK